MNEMESKIQELYGKYTKLDNGTYYIKTKNGNEIYIPETISQNQSMIAYAPGSGGFPKASRLFKELYSGQDAPSCVTVVSYTSFDYDNILNIGTETVNNLGGNVDNVVYASFSLGGMTGLNKSENYLKENPNVSMSIISCDGCDIYNTLYDSYPTIKETQTPFIMLSNGFKYKYTYLKTIENGYNSYYLDVQNNADHSKLNEDMINYLLLYAIGDQDEMKENDIGYTLYKGSNLEENIDIENIKLNGTNIYEGYDKNKYKNILNLNNITFNNLDNFNDSDIIGDGYIKADFIYTQTALNSIRSTISKANIATKTPSLPIAGAGGLLSAITACINTYSSMTVSLYSKLAQETEATASYAQSIVNTDKKLEKELTDINNNTTLIPDTKNTTSSIINSAATINTVSNAVTNTTTTTTEKNNINNTETKTIQETTPTVNTNKTQEKTPVVNTNTTTEKTNTQTQSTTHKTSHIYQNTNPTSDNLTWNYSDGHNLTLTIDNGQVTGMKFTYNYDSIDELNKNINNILKGQIDQKYIDKMTIIDKTVEVTIKKDYFNDLSLNTIRKLFFK